MSQTNNKIARDFLGVVKVYRNKNIRGLFALRVNSTVSVIVQDDKVSLYRNSVLPQTYSDTFWINVPAERSQTYGC